MRQFRCGSKEGNLNSLKEALAAMAPAAGFVLGLGIYFIPLSVVLSRKVDCDVGWRAANLR